MSVKRIGAIAVAAGSVVATVVVRRRHARLRRHAHLYLEDGSTLPLPEDGPDAAAVLDAAEELLGLARAS